MGIVSEYVCNLIAKQVNDNGLVVWYDPDGAYADVVAVLDLPDTTVLGYTDSFLRLRWEIDQKHLMDGEEAPRLVVYVPLAQDQTHHALIELEAAGVIMQPGQQPPARNTRLAVVARNALKGVLGDETAAHVEKQTEAGKRTLAALTFEFQAMVNVETFPAIERALLRHAENRLLEKTDGDMLTLAKSRLSRFWCDAEPKLQARWALVASAAEVLLEADRVEKALKKAPASVTGMIEQYAVGSRQGAVSVGKKTDTADSTEEPWCLLDTRHRHLESRWYNFEVHGDDHDSIEKLVIRARRRYVAVGSEIAWQFLTQLQKKAPDKSVARQCEVFENHVKPFLGEKKTAYMWVDALRFEMGRELACLLREDFEVDLQPALAAVPTVTEIGMAALLPGARGVAKLVTAGSGKLALEINGTVIKDRKDRLTFMKEHAGVEVFDVKLDNLLPKPSKKVREGIENAQLILVTSQEIDELC
ncbi:MAG: PglZ domain-containing protein [Candidatus Atribacteria bacterium]|nr:PglZ domain-containing protein [Candidatus Atribacteria bacterium]